MPSLPYPRDLAILEALGAGPATVQYLHKHYCTKPDGKMIAKQTFNEYIAKLAKNEYIKIKGYYDPRKKNKTVRVAMLADNGANLVCECIPNREREYLRLGEPTSTEIRHELLLAGIIRAMWNEEKNRKNFKIEYIYDDKKMKSTFRKKHEKIKGVFFPDLRVRVHPKHMSPIKFNLELDAGQKSRTYWLRKISSWDDRNIVITTESHRTLYLSDIVEKERKRLNGSVCFSTYGDFVKYGLTYWLATLGSSENKKKVFLFRDPSEVDNLWSVPQKQ